MESRCRETGTAGSAIGLRTDREQSRHRAPGPLDHGGLDAGSGRGEVASATTRSGEAAVGRGLRWWKQGRRARAAPGAGAAAVQGMALHSPGLAGKTDRKAPDQVAPRSVNVSAAGVYPGCAGWLCQPQRGRRGRAWRFAVSEWTATGVPSALTPGAVPPVESAALWRFRVVRRHFARAHRGVFSRDMRLVSRRELLIDGEPVEPMAVVPVHPFSPTFVGKRAVHG